MGQDNGNENGGNGSAAVKRNEKNWGSSVFKGP